MIGGPKVLSFGRLRFSYFFSLIVKTLRENARKTRGRKISKNAPRVLVQECLSTLQADAISTLFFLRHRFSYDGFVNRFLRRKSGAKAGGFFSLCRFISLYSLVIGQARTGRN